MRQIIVTIRDKIAVPQSNALYVCGNSDYSILFDFDAEWDEYKSKTARFEYGGRYQDVVFDGRECPAPIISDTYSFNVGVFAGDLRTTTPAYIPCKKSILCASGSPAAPREDVYAQIMEKLNQSRLESPDWFENDPDSDAYIKNRFGAYEANDSDTLTWGGETEDRLVVDGSALVDPEGTGNLTWLFVKLSDLVPTKDDVVGGIAMTAISYGNETSFAAPGEDAQNAFEDDGLGWFEILVVIPYDNYDLDGLTLPEKGMYAMWAYQTAEENGETFTFDMNKFVSLTIHGYASFWGIHTIPEKYLPETAFAQTDWNETDENSPSFMKNKPALGVGIAVEGGGEMFNNAESASGVDSHAEGNNTEASGDYSHAEGAATLASGQGAHAEGNSTKAQGSGSHAEGSATRAGWIGAHAEGISTVAENGGSHAEGKSTIAGGLYQHVQGKNNVYDGQSKYAHIVGNGPSYNERSNAHTLDWDGLGWFAGGVKVGGTGQDDAEAKELATKEYVDQKVASSGSGGTGGVAFEVDETLTLANGILSVNTADDVEQDNTLPVTSAAVFAEVGNINALLETI